MVKNVVFPKDDAPSQIPLLDGKRLGGAILSATICICRLDRPGWV